jgi:hypothetical protein
MNREQIPILALRWAVGLVVLGQALHLAMSPATAAHFVQSGLPRWIRPVLGWVEALAAILFLVPAAKQVGGYTLLLTFAAAMTLHFHLGDYQVGALIVYAVAVIVCMADGRRQFGDRAA